MEQNLILEAKGITKKYGEHVALNKVDIQVGAGSIFGLLGPNGAGKSTFIRIVNRILMPDEGSIWIKGENLSEKHVLNIGYLPEERRLYKKMKVGEQLMYFAQLRGLSNEEAKRKSKETLKEFDAQDWWNKRVEDLSKGMAQKVQFVATMLHEPDLMILDEPFSGFDPLNADLIKNQILNLKNRGASVILSTHRMESVEELCDNLVLINKSQVILQGKTSDIKQRFREHSFAIKYKGHLQTDNSFDIIELKENTDISNALIKAAPEVSNRDLIQRLSMQVELMEFAEKLPDMNEIFIRSVKDNA
ncbi:MAG: ATP-binding cassette domain-containing protein [Bacteroidia bacterium]|nr:ATP-binding cassette domain-containing protein [Bacteroidia bacterium]